MPQQFGFNLDNFLSGLQDIQSKQKSNKDYDRSKSLTYVNLSHPDNYGKYQILPMLSTATYSPYVYLFDTREVKLPNPRKPETTTWYKILPDEAYNIMDETGRIVSSLTDSERALLAELRGLFDKLMTYPNSKDIARVKNYTLFQGKCINQYDLQTKVKRSNFNALFICTSRTVASAVNDDITNQSISYNGVDFVSQIYSRQKTGRTGWLIFSINRGGIGFDVKVTHTANIPVETIQPYEFTDEDLELFQDPVKSFLAWQSGSDRTYNSEVLTDLKFKLIDLINKYEGTASSVSPSSVQQVTTSTATSAVQQPNQQQSPDPMLARAMAANSPEVAPQSTMSTSQGFINDQNNNPFQTPPAASIDPVSGIPVSPVVPTYQQGNVGSQQFMGNVATAPQFVAPQPSDQGFNNNPQFQAPSWATPAGSDMPFPTDSASVNPFKK